MSERPKLRRENLRYSFHNGVKKSQTHTYLCRKILPFQNFKDNVWYTHTHTHWVFWANPSTPKNDKHPSLHLPDVWQEGEGQEESRHKTTDVGKVVNPRKQTKGEEEDWDGQQLGKSPPRSLEDLPALKQLHKQTGQDAELASCRTHLR